MAKKRKNNNTSKILLITLSVLLIGGTGAVGYLSSGFTNWDTSTWFKNEEDSGLKTDVDSKGVTLKLLSTKENSDGTVTKTFTYSVNPSNSDNQGISVTAKFIDGSDCSAYITATKNETEKTISVTCKKAFSKQVKVEIVSSDNASAKATVTLDYVKKLLSLGLNDNYEHVIGNNAIGADHYTKKLVDINDLIIPTYSAYTIDKTYNFQFDINTLEVTIDEMVFGNYMYNDPMPSGFVELYKNKIKAKNTTLPTADELWNVTGATNAYRGLLKSLAANPYWSDRNENYIAIVVEGTIKCVEDPSKSVSTTDLNNGSAFYTLSFNGYDFSSKKVNVDSISAELGNIQF